MPHTCQQLITRMLFIEIHQINVDKWPQETFDLTPLDTYGQHTTILAFRIVPESSCPFSKGIVRCKIGGRENRNGAFSTLGGIIHRGHEVRPRSKIPGLDNGV